MHDSWGIKFAPGQILCPKNLRNLVNIGKKIKYRYETKRLKQLVHVLRDSQIKKDGI